ncbi:MAG: glycosyltransferase family 4 protein [Myxococcales bacterium]|nr:glycosyltransferase family 4 protein [Myxococcales bacterium]
MKVAIALGGTDYGRSGLGRWTRAVLPPLRRSLAARGATLVAIGTDREAEAYRDELAGVDRHRAPSVFDRPSLSAVYAVGLASLEARRAGANVLVFPAANRRASWVKSLPTIAVVHDLRTASDPGRHGQLRRWFVREVIGRALGRARSIVAVSATTADEIHALLGDDVPEVTVVRNGVDTRRFCPADAGDPRVARARRALSLTEPYLLYPSRFEAPAKNHQRLIEAFARSSARATHKLVLVGPDWGGEGAARSLADRLGVADRVCFGGAVSDDTLSGLYAGASLVTVVGTAEGFGLPVLEALASGVPVLAARAGALPEVVGSHGALVDPYSVPAMCAAIDACLADDAFASRARRDGPVYASEHSWDRAAESLASLCFSATRSSVALPSRAVEVLS